MIGSWLFKLGCALAVLFFLNTAQAACTSPSGVEGQFQYISTDYKWCDGTSWQSMTVTATGSPCSVAGTMYYNANDILFCNGSNWVSMNGATTNGSCSGFTIGTFRYNSSPKKMEWCDGTNWKFMSAGAGGGGGSGSGYFVLTSATFTGNMGGLTGANASCYSNLANNDWTGRSEAGTLTTSRVRAWLCDGTTCNNLSASSTYKFAVSGSLTAGGATMSTDASGAGPGDSALWSDATHFGAVYTYWANRTAGTTSAWGLTPDASGPCLDWTNQGSVLTVRSGSSNATNTLRWYDQIPACVVTQRIICDVAPAEAPAAFDFTDVSNAASNTLITSNIVQITGLSTAAPVSVWEPYGTPEYRICADSSCSSVVQNWGTAVTNISNNQYLQVRVISSYGTTRKVIVGVGGGGADWLVTSTTPTGYFVLYNVITGGTQGGLSGLDAACYNGLTTNNWKNKASAGTLTASRIKAFSCTTSFCNPLFPNTVYTFAKATDTTAGGATFTTDSNGDGPNDSADWSGVNYFNGALSLFTARAAGTATKWGGPATATCSDWTSNTGKSVGGVTNATTELRWSGTQPQCSSLSGLVCMVHPDNSPDAYIFTDQSGVATSTLINSNIVQITGLQVGAPVSISGGGSPQYRICSDSACSSIVADWTTTSYPIANNQYLQLRLTSSSSAATELQATADVGGVTSVWSVGTTGTPANGYFVLTAAMSVRGNLGGLSGANGICLTELMNNPWKGKTVAGTLSAARVKAFLCDLTTCNNLQNSTSYAFATTDIPNAGGTIITTDASGQGPGDTTSWGGSTYFGENVNWWSGRFSANSTLWPITPPTTNTCSDWTSALNTVNGTIGETGNTAFSRWNTSTSVGQCNRPDVHLICSVDPLDAVPDAFSFTDQNGVTASTQTASNIVQITGLAAAAAVSVSGGGSPQFRVCADSTCSANPAWGSASSAITNNQYLQVRATSSASSGTAVDTTVSVGGVSDTWTITTLGGTSTGYFVLTQTAWTGNLGGLSGADAKCLSDLTTLNWNGKGSAGTLDSTRVKAFLCDGTTCQNLQANAEFKFATAGNATSGGSSLYTDADGLGPGDAADWSGNGYFGTAVWVWSGRSSGSTRNWAQNKGADTCTNWTSAASGVFGHAGNTMATNAQRWSTPMTGYPCNASQRLYCFVNPNADLTPNAFSFTDQTSLSRGVQYSSNIVQITGIDGSARVSTNGAGSAQVRVCSASDCSSIITDWAAAATVNTGQYVQARATASVYAGTALTVRISVGTVTDDWVLTTSGVAPQGYLVLASATYSGNLSGLSGANASCLSNLTANTWLNKGSAGTLDSTRVKAFLCDKTSCNNLEPGITYNFAVSGNATGGGATFTADGVGRGPNDNNNWNGATYLTSTWNIWMNRGSRSTSTFDLYPASSVDADSCFGWTNSSNGNYGIIGVANGTTDGRWQSQVGGCPTVIKLLCAVAPAIDLTPDAFSFTDVTGAATSTLTTSNIVQINGVDVPASVSVSGGGSPQFRICTSSDCSSGAGTWGTSGSVASGQYLQLRATSSAGQGTAVNVTVTVGTGNDTWSVTTAGTPPNGYFVLTSGTYTGNLGGMSGANATCLTELTNNNWLGKGSATIDSTHVKAFICDESACQNLQANTTYKFAHAGDATGGGASFTTDSSGSGPGDSSAWNGATYFNANAMWYSGRDAGTATMWATTPLVGKTCVSWSSSANGNKSSYGELLQTDMWRWSRAGLACGTSVNLICFVNP